MMPHVAILMAVWNGAAHLQAQLTSIAGQDHDDWSLHVADDGSEDDSPALLAAFAQAHPGRVFLSRGPGQGGTANFLTLLRDADLPPGAAIAWCDQDDVWLPDRLGRAARAVAGEAPAYYACRYQLLLPDGSLGAPSAPLRKPVTFGNALVQNPLPGHTMVANGAATDLLRRSVDAALAADVPYHDWWTCQVLVGAGCPVVFEDAPGVLYRQHQGNQVGARGGIFASLDRLKMIADGRLSDWLTRNARALSDSDVLTPDNRALLERFTHWRHTRGRRPSLNSLGVERQDLLGGLALNTAARLRLF